MSDNVKYVKVNKSTNIGRFKPGDIVEVQEYNQYWVRDGFAKEYFPPVEKKIEVKTTVLPEEKKPIFNLEIAPTMKESIKEEVSEKPVEKPAEKPVEKVEDKPAEKK